MSISIKDIAEMTGLSITTVSHAINGTRKVSKRSHQLINEAIEKTGYRPNFAAQMLKNNKSYIVALIIPSTEPDNTTNSFFFDVMEGARTKLLESNYNLMVAAYAEGREGSHLNQLMLLKKQLVDGILIVPYERNPSEEYIQQLYGLNIPVVLLDRRMENVECPMVFTDNYDGTAKAIELLSSSGCKRIGLLNGKTNISTFNDRLQSYYDTLQRLKLPIDNQLIKMCTEFKIKTGYQMMEELAKSGADAVFAANSVLLIGALEYLRDHHLRVPEDMAIVVFDDHDWMKVTTPPITAVYQNPFSIGKTGAELLLKVIDGEKPIKNELKLPCELHVRLSHGASK